MPGIAPAGGDCANRTATVRDRATVEPPLVTTAWNPTVPVLRPVNEPTQGERWHPATTEPPRACRIVSRPPTGTAARAVSWTVAPSSTTAPGATASQTVGARLPAAASGTRTRA